MAPRTTTACVSARTSCLSRYLLLLLLLLPVQN